MRKLFAFLSFALLSLSAYAAPGGLYQNPSTGPSSISGAVPPGVINGTTPQGAVSPTNPHGTVMQNTTPQNMKKHMRKHAPSNMNYNY